MGIVIEAIIIIIIIVMVLLVMLIFSLYSKNNHSNKNNICDSNVIIIIIFIVKSLKSGSFGQPASHELVRAVATLIPWLRRPVFPGIPYLDAM